MKSGKALLGFIAGVSIGALLGVLFAPEKGSVMRQKISKKGGDYIDDLKEGFSEMLDDWADKFESEADEMTDKVKKTVRDRKDDLKSKID